MITGAHAIMFTTDPVGVRAFLRDVLELPWVDAGDGWLIFALPPAEAAVHPGGSNGVHELYLMCDDLEAERTALERRGVRCAPVHEASWGSGTRFRLPGGGEIALYQPRHPTTLERA